MAAQEGGAPHPTSCALPPAQATECLLLLAWAPAVGLKDWSRRDKRELNTAFSGWFRSCINDLFRDQEHVSFPCLRLSKGPSSCRVPPTAPGGSDWPRIEACGGCTDQGGEHGRLAPMPAGGRTPPRTTPLQMPTLGEAHFFLMCRFFHVCAMCKRGDGFRQKCKKNDVSTTTVKTAVLDDGNLPGALVLTKLID